MRQVVPPHQMAAVALVEPAAHEYPAAQRPLHALVDRPMLAPNVPAGQGVTAVVPVVQYEPMGHAETLNVHWHPVYVVETSLYRSNCTRPP